ncbi:hypothetical protein HELRODRAFT_160353 [Helobdella robusta]|uniref:Uncharacterized protein n=1 Tax=Helobdella robusta TaxID=6412 RepID=T1EQ48_HELRO|nr:hypothetical protein HELRODRAFT_160353 [Helobdella robusta]ESO06196.1 hypothetical protein HELRODRAFT_160353 [Helobdella robusta]
MCTASNPGHGHLPSHPSHSLVQSTVTFAGDHQRLKSLATESHIEEPLSAFSSRPSSPCGDPSTQHTPGSGSKEKQIISTSNFPIPAPPQIFNNNNNNNVNNIYQMPMTSTTQSNNDSSTTLSQQRTFLPGFTDYSRIPLSQRRVPPPKLSLTLDLSVTNPGTSTSIPTSKHKKVLIVGTSKDQQMTSTSNNAQHGIAASSGVIFSSQPPRLSPKEDPSKHHNISSLFRNQHNLVGSVTSAQSSTATSTTSTTSSQAAPSSTTTSLTRHHISGTIVSRARRPSSLQYCIKTGSSRANRSSLVSGISLSQSRRSSMPVEQMNHRLSISGMNSLLKRDADVVAPKATPEDSLIDSFSDSSSGSSSDMNLATIKNVSRFEFSGTSASKYLMDRDVKRERFLGTLAEVVESAYDSPQMLGDEIDDENDDKNAYDINKNLTPSMSRDSNLKITTENQHKKTFDYKPSSIMQFFKQNVELTRVEAEKLSNFAEIMQAKENLKFNTLDRLRLSNSNNDSHTNVNSTHLYTSSSPNLPTQRSTLNSAQMPTKFSEAYLSSLQQNVDESANEHFQNTQQPPILTLNALPINDDQAASKQLNDETLSEAESSDLTYNTPRKRTHLKLDLSSGSGLSPGSPSYDERHARFSHIGIHALDVFFSPEDDDASPSNFRKGNQSKVLLWRPLATSSKNVRTPSFRSDDEVSLPSSRKNFKRHNYTTPPYIDAKTPTLVEQVSTASPLRPSSLLPLQSFHHPRPQQLDLPQSRAPIVTSLDIFCDGSTDDDEDDELEFEEELPNYCKDANGNYQKHCSDADNYPAVQNLAVLPEFDNNNNNSKNSVNYNNHNFHSNNLVTTSLINNQLLDSTHLNSSTTIHRMCNSEVIGEDKLKCLQHLQTEINNNYYDSNNNNNINSANNDNDISTEDNSNIIIPSPPNILQHPVTCSSLTTGQPYNKFDQIETQRQQPYCKEKISNVTSWLKLPHTQHKDGHSPSCGTVWPADLSICSRNLDLMQSVTLNLVTFLKTYHFYSTLL